MRDDNEKNGASPEEENGGETREFLRETVTNRGAVKHRAGKVFWLIIAAVAFGLIASLVFAIARPFFESRFYPEPPETEESFELPTESETEPLPPETEPLPPETDPQQSESETSGESETENETQIEYLHEANEDARRDIANANRYVTQITGDGSEGTEGFAGGQVSVSGLVWTATSRTGLILADSGALEGCTSYTVTFWDGSQTAGTLKAADSETGIAVISVSLESLVSAGIDEGWPGLGQSGAMRTGEAAFVVGEPYGFINSGGTVQVVYNMSGVPALDGSLDYLYTDMVCEGSCFLLNLNGSIVGFHPAAMNTDEPGTFYGISSLARIIERLANGRQVAELGIQGWNYSMGAEEGTEAVYGVYVQSVVQDGPAYRAGIQAGDLIVSIGETAIFDTSTLQQALLASEPGDTVSVRILRQARDGYEEQAYPVTLAAR